LFHLLALCCQLTYPIKNNGLIDMSPRNPNEF
jgi:hypothetical protein